MNAFDNLNDMLTEMQHELAIREWGDDVHDRIPRAIEFRGKLFAAIQAFAREQYEPKVPA